MTTLQEIVTLLAGELLTPGMDLEKECTKVFASDMMSDVLAFMDPGSILLTAQANPHVVRTACLADVSAVIFVQGKRPDLKVVDAARENNIPLILTGLPMFEACARIAQSFPGDL